MADSPPPHEEELTRLRARVESLTALLREEIATKTSLERAFRQQGTRYLNLVRRAPWLVTLVSARGAYVDVNRCFTDTFGGMYEDYIDQAVGTNGEPEAWTEAIQEFLHDGDSEEGSAQIEIEAEGVRRHFAIQMSREPTDGLVSILAADQTAQVDALREARAAGEAKSRFLAVMSHEIRTPMNGVLGTAELLRHQDLTDEQQELVDTINDAGGTLLRVINDILDLTKAEEGAIEVEALDFDPRQLVRSTMALSESRIVDGGVTLASEIGSDVPEQVVGDPYRLRQVLLNVLGNAIKFTERGQVTLRVSGEADGHSLRFEVEDTGIGIPADRLDRLFKPFTQIDSSTTRRYGGTGLGLVISRRLVEALGGEMQVRSTEGVGTRVSFTVDAPASARPESPAKIGVASSADAQPLAGFKVLVAEDNPVNQRVAAGMLRRLGCDATFVDTGALAVEAVETESFDAVLMDVEMPVLDGLAATREIRRQHGEELPIIAMTANVVHGAMDICIEAGMSDYLSKPFNLEGLARETGLAAAQNERLMGLSP